PAFVVSPAASAPGPFRPRALDRPGSIRRGLGRRGADGGGEAGSQNLGDVQRAAVGEVADLLPAGDTGDGDQRPRALRLHLREEPLRADLARNLVVLRFV